MSNTVKAHAIALFEQRFDADAYDDLAESARLYAVDAVEFDAFMHMVEEAALELCGYPGTEGACDVVVVIATAHRDRLTVAVSRFLSLFISQDALPFEPDAVQLSLF